MDKKPWQSKTLWMAAISALAPVVFPPAAAFIAANPAAYSALAGLVFAGLRMVTDGAVSISD